MSVQTAERDLVENSPLLSETFSSCQESFNKKGLTCPEAHANSACKTNISKTAISCRGPFTKRLEAPKAPEIKTRFL